MTLLLTIFVLINSNRHHTNTRKIAPFVFNSYFAPMLGIPPKGGNVEEQKVIAEKALAMIDSHFLKEGKFLNGQENLTIADVSCFCELE